MKTREETIDWLKATIAIGETHVAEVMITHPKGRLYVWGGREDVGRQEYLAGLHCSIEHGKMLLRMMERSTPESEVTE